MCFFSQVLFVNGKAEQVRISRPAVQGTLLLGQNGDQYFTGQIDEVPHSLTISVFFFAIILRFSVNVMAGPSMEYCCQCVVVLQQVFERHRTRTGQILSVSRLI